MSDTQPVREHPVLGHLREAFSIKTFSAKPVTVALGVFVVVMSFLILAFAVASISEQVAMVLVFVLFKALVLAVFFAVVLGRLAIGIKRMLQRNEEYRRYLAEQAMPESQARVIAAAQASDDAERHDMAARLLGDDDFFRSVTRSEKRRSATQAAK